MTRKIDLIVEEIYKDSENLKEFSDSYRKYLEQEVDENTVIASFNKYRSKKSEYLKENV